MAQTIRRRLLFSQLIPLLVMLPVMGIFLVYSIESRFMLPKFSNNLLGDARLLAEISNAEYELWGNPILFESLISRVQLDPSIKVMFLAGNGSPLYSSDPSDYLNSTIAISPVGLKSALSGQEIVLSNYSILRVRDILIDVYEPVLDSNLSVIGIVRVTYRVESLYNIFGTLRWQIGLIVLAGLLISALISTGLAVRISKPITKITKAIYDLAAGHTHQPLEIKGFEELQSQAQAVNYLVAELDSHEKSRRQLLANLVHELGRPLGSIRSAIRALENGAEKDPSLYQDLTNGIELETTKLQHLLDDLAHLYDQTVGNLELNLQKVDLSEWLSVILKPSRFAAEEKGLRWQEELSPEKQELVIDPDRLAQVIENLLNNAVKYTKPGGTITIRSTNDDQGWQFSVEDNGVGIRADEVKSIFDPFYRGEQGRRIKQGMGLGLSIARDLTKAHGGQLEVTSQPGQGSTFSLKIPRKPANPEQPTPPPLF